MIGRAIVLVLTVTVVAAVGATLYVISRPSERASSPPMNRAPAESPQRATAPITPTKPAAAARGASATAPPAPAPAADSKPELGTLIIESDVPETSVFVDRVYLGNAPVTVRNLTPGRHHLNMSAAGYDGVSEGIDVLAGTHTISMRFKEIKLDASIDVTHKHGVGSCSGVLRASPQRLAYETTNTGDAFTVALTNLDTFEVDYVQKNLRVKVRDGKTYNFTDHAGNADRLYQFHQTVEKVRQRLLAGRRP